MNRNIRGRTKLDFIFHMVKRGYARLRNDDGKLQWYHTMENNTFVNDDVKRRFMELEFEVEE
jgi:hypothetical protein